MTKYRLFSKAVTGFAIAVTVSSTMAQPSPAQETLSFFCDTFQGNYVTKVRTTKGNKAIIIYDNWATDSGETPRKRCQEVSRRFQQFYNQNTLQYMRTGIVNHYPVIYVTPQKEVSCDEKHVLITLKKGTNPEAALESLVSRSRGDSSSAIAKMSSQNSEKPSYFSRDNQGNFYVDIKELIETTPVEQ